MAVMTATFNSKCEMDDETARGDGDHSRQMREHVKPQITESQVMEIVRRLYGLRIQTLKKLVSYYDVNYFITVDQKDNMNPNIGEVWSHGYLFKVLNSRDTQMPQYVANERKEHLVQLFTYIPGTVLGDVPYSVQLCYDVGVGCGKLHRQLQGFHHPFYDTYTPMWSISNLSMLWDYIYAVQNDENRLMICAILKIFSKEVPPVYNKLQRGMIHGDLNEQNILVGKIKEKQFYPENHIGQRFEICGIIDFGDAAQSYLIFDVAIAICYLMIDCKTLDPMDIGGHVLGGYLSQMQLNEDEIGVLKRCVEARICQSLVLGAYSYSLDPSNTYLLLTSTNGWSCLRTLWNTPKDEVMSRWRNILAIYNK